MLKAVLDTTVLVSAFLSAKPGRAAFDLLQLASEARFEVVLSEPILAETADVLLTRPHLRSRYRYTDGAVADYVNGLRRWLPTSPSFPLYATRRTTSSLPPPSRQLPTTCAHATRTYLTVEATKASSS